MATYFCGDKVNLKFLGDGTTTTLTFDSTNPPFPLPYHGNYAGFYIEQYVASDPSSGVFISQAAGSSPEIQVLTFQDSGGHPIGFTYVEVIARPLYQSL